MDVFIIDEGSSYTKYSYFTCNFKILLNKRMNSYILFVFGCILCILLLNVESFQRIPQIPSIYQRKFQSSNLLLSINEYQSALDTTMNICDTSISEEDVLGVTGSVTSLPDPIFALAFAGIVFLGVAILQFSLGDLNKQEAQARVRDFLKTRQDTERKRGIIFSSVI